ncbi:MAG: invasion protein IalB [Motiliproteus sp.]|jgi:invasion protein IalB
MEKKLKLYLMAISVSLLLPFSTAYAAANSGDKFGDWLFECQALAANKTNCMLSQTLINKESKQRVLRLALSNIQDSKGLVLIAVLPLGIYLPSGVTLNTEKGTVIPLNLQTCTQQGCIATSALSSKHIKAIKAENELVVAFSVNKNTPVTLPVSLNGVSAGLKEIN